MKKRRVDYQRGRIKEIWLSRPITLNGNRIGRAIVEIDHINYGLNKETGGLNKRRRTNFSLTDIDLFIQLLDEEYIFMLSARGRISKYYHEVICPVEGRFKAWAFALVFTLDYNQPDMIRTVTMYPRKKK